MDCKAEIPIVRFTEHKDAKPQDCPVCLVLMTVTEDYYGAGSHYWVYSCPVCRKPYTFDTHRLKLYLLGE